MNGNGSGFAGNHLGVNLAYTKFFFVTPGRDDEADARQAARGRRDRRAAGSSTTSMPRGATRRRTRPSSS